MPTYFAISKYIDHDGEEQYDFHTFKNRKSAEEWILRSGRKHEYASNIDQFASAEVSQDLAEPCVIVKGDVVEPTFSVSLPGIVEYVTKTEILKTTAVWVPTAAGMEACPDGLDWASWNFISTAIPAIIEITMGWLCGMRAVVFFKRFPQTLTTSSL